MFLCSSICTRWHSSWQHHHRLSHV